MTSKQIYHKFHLLQVHAGRAIRNLMKNLYPNTYRNITFSGKSRTGKREPISFHDKEKIFGLLEEGYKVDTTGIKKIFVLKEQMTVEEQRNVYKWRSYAEATLSQLHKNVNSILIALLLKDLFLKLII